MNDELQQALDNLHAIQHQLRIAERDVALQAELDDMRAGAPRRQAMTFPGTDCWYLDNVLGLIRNEKHEPIARLTNLDAGERIVSEHNALSGLDPAKLAALIEACERYTTGPSPDGCGFCREGICSARAHVAITTALAALRGAAS